MTKYSYSTWYYAKTSMRSLFNEIRYGWFSHMMRWWTGTNNFGVLGASLVVQWWRVWVFTVAWVQFLFAKISMSVRCNQRRKKRIVWILTMAFSFMKCVSLPMHEFSPSSVNWCQCNRRKILMNIINGFPFILM